MTSYWDRWLREQHAPEESHNFSNDYAEATMVVFTTMLRALRVYASDADGDSLWEAAQAVMDERETNPIAQMFVGHILNLMVKEGD